MRRKLSMVEEVSNDLVTRLYEGEFEKGAFLPPLSQLCSRYHVGLNTMKRVISKLAAQGFLVTTQGRPAQVQFDFQELLPEDTYLPDFVLDPAQLRDYYQAVHILFVPLYVEASLSCREEEQARLRQLAACAPLDPPRSEDSLRWNLQFFRMTTFLLKNLFTFDIIHNVMERTLLPVLLFQRENSQVRNMLLQAVVRGKDICLALERKDREELRCLWDRLLLELESITGYVLDQGLMLYLGSGEDKPFQSDTLPKHFLLAEGLRKRIMRGTFPLGGFLPSLREIKDSFCVSLSTARKALELLRELGLVETKNGVGTMVVALSAQEPSPRMRGIALEWRERYMDTLAFFRQVCPDVLRHIGSVDVAWISRFIEGPWNVSNGYSFPIVLYALFESTGSRAMCVIGEVGTRSLFWGFHADDIPAFSLCREETHRVSLEILQALSAGEEEKILSLLEQGFDNMYPT